MLPASPTLSGGAFKFHFEFGESGYVYIVGPGEKNQPTAFLTEKPAAISGWKPTRLRKGSDFSFPRGMEHWLELDGNREQKTTHIIFSPDAFSGTGFLVRRQRENL